MSSQEVPANKMSSGSNTTSGTNACKNPNKMGTITVVGLGPAGPNLLTAEATEALNQEHVFLRTNQHPAAARFTNAKTFDDVYETSETFDDVYRSIVKQLVASAHEFGAITYGVPGSPLIAETTVELLRRENSIEVVIVPALSFLDLCWQELNIDPLSVSPRIVDGHKFAELAAGERGPMLVAQCDQSWVLSDIKLAYEDKTPEFATVLQRLGSADQKVFTIPWEELDREVEPDVRTSIYIDKVQSPVASELSRLDEIARELRSKCPWDAEQTHKSLGKHLIEESYEALDAIEAHDQNAPADNQDPDEHLIEELGDVLFQVFAHSAIGAEQGRFTVGDVAHNVAEKLIERHPHVYGNEVADSANDVAATWEERKMKAKGRTSALEGIPRQLPALMLAQKVISRAKRAGFEFNKSAFGVGGSPSQLSEVQMPKDAEQLGEVLFAIAQFAQSSGFDAEEVLRATIDRHIEQFRAFESANSESEVANK